VTGRQVSSAEIDRPVLGVALMLAFCAVAPLADSFAKLVGDRVPLLQLLLVRFGIQVALLLPVVLATRTRLVWTNRIMGFVALRTLLHILGIGAMFLSLRFLPLADAIAIAFVMPFILLLLGRFFLGEEVGTRRIVACIVGFIGTLFVIQPSFSTVGAPALLPLFVALVFALFMLVTRRIARDTDPVALQVTSGAMAGLLLAPLALFGPGSGEFALIRPILSDLWMLGALGVLGTFGHLLMTWSLRFAPASTLAPMQYLEIPMAAIYGWILFRDFPNGLALIGIAITISAGLYIVFREQRLNRASRLPSPPPAPPVA